MRRSVLSLLVTLAAASCLAPPRPIETFASARVASDLDTYSFHRVGLLPFTGLELERTSADEIQAAFLAEAGSHLAFEVIPLEAVDLQEIPRSEPFRRGRYRASTILELARRYRLDGILVGTVTDRQPFSPQRLGLSLELVAAETGMAVWTASVHLDTSQERVRRALKAWFEDEGGGGSEGEWSVVLLSPARLARFAAWELVGLYDAP